MHAMIVCKCSKVYEMLTLIIKISETANVYVILIVALCAFVPSWCSAIFYTKQI